MLCLAEWKLSPRFNSTITVFQFLFSTGIGLAACQELGRPKTFGPQEDYKTHKHLFLFTKMKQNSMEICIWYTQGEYKKLWLRDRNRRFREIYCYLYNCCFVNYKFASYMCCLLQLWIFKYLYINLISYLNKQLSYDFYVYLIIHVHIIIM